MATFGVEGIRYFSHLRASGEVADAPDLTYVFNICNGFDSALRNAGHTRRFYWANRDVWENDLHSTNMGGDDDAWSDNVDAFSSSPMATTRPGMHSSRTTSTSMHGSAIR